MNFYDTMKWGIDSILLLSCLTIVLGSIFLTIRFRFVQFRLFPVLWKMLFSPRRASKEGTTGTISPYKALFTAMSTTLGISTIVAPIIAISLGGPGALLGFLITSILGSAATYAEVNLSIQHRKRSSDGTFMGGPMQYIKVIFSPFAAKWYASFCLILMISWSSAQANQLAAILNSPLLGTYRIPTPVSGFLIASIVIFVLMGGIQRVGSLSAKLVPTMFLLYLGSVLWILFSHISLWGGLFHEMLSTFLHPKELGSGVLVGGVFSALRWGIFKGVQTSECGVGTQAIPHSMAETQNATEQAMLAMLSTYTAGFVAFLSGCVALITKTYLNPSLPLGISMVAASFSHYFSFFGIGIVVISTLLFGFGTILGNSYNGSHCFDYLRNKETRWYYLIATAVMIFVGAISEVTLIWSFVDLILICVAVPHMAALVLHAYKTREVALLV